MRGPVEGETMAAGDVVNTAARLQAAAPLNGVLVGGPTYRATADAIVYRDAEPVSAKGKSAPIEVWEAVQARSRFGVDVSMHSSTDLVGRRRDLELLVSTLDRVREERSPQLVTLAGVPGIGKSRLVSELFRTIDENVAFVRWRQGRSLPYGDGVTFWALAEVVKAEAGILETDTPALSDEKLRHAVDRVVADDPEADWVLRHLRPLAGLGDEAAESQEESFAAWRRFLEALAEELPLVVVLEDLHWADDALLDFVDGLVDAPARASARARDCASRASRATTRLGRRQAERAHDLAVSAFGRGHGATRPGAPRPGGARRADGGSPARAGRRQPALRRAVRRALHERGDVLELPESVQGIIAARLDGLSEQEKQLLQDAAVVGKVFWVGAIQATGGVPRWQAEELLHALELKEFVRRARRILRGRAKPSTRSDTC